jgi:selenophosphate synthetase-related protein
VGSAEVRESKAATKASQDAVLGHVEVLLVKSYDNSSEIISISMSFSIDWSSWTVEIRGFSVRGRSRSLGGNRS